MPGKQFARAKPNFCYCAILCLFLYRVNNFLLYARRTKRQPPCSLLATISGQKIRVRLRVFRSHPPQGDDDDSNSCNFGPTSAPNRLPAVSTTQPNPARATTSVTNAQK